MISTKFATSVCVFALISYVSADSAGLAPMPYGLAYGGIPYGSISGMLAKYQRAITATDNYYEPTNRYQPRPPSPIVITPNYRAAGLAARSTGPVQIYNLPGVVAPGVVGTLSQIGY